MITTVSLNPCIDRLAEVERFDFGGLNRVVGGRYDAGGKGLNVALVVTRLGLDAECIGLMYKENGRVFENRLLANGTAYEFVWREGRARTNVKLYDRGTGVMTEINEPGETVNEEQLKKVKELVLQHAESSDFIVFSGSLPPGCPVDFYQTLIREVDGLGCRAVLDADGERLVKGIEARPFMIKPNRFELETMLGERLDSIPRVRDAALKLIDRGIQVVAVSLGAGGALITDGRETYFAPKLEVEVKSTVGAGDSMVAGLTAGFLAEEPLEEVFRRGVACATAMCMTEGSKTFEKPMYKKALEMVKLQKL